MRSQMRTSMGICPGTSTFSLLLILAFLSFAALAYSEETVVRTFPIQFLFVDEAEALIKPLLSTKGSMASYKGTNTLIVRDTPSNLAQIERILREFDVRPKQIRIKTQFVDELELQRVGVNIKWTYTDGHWTIGNLTRTGKDEGSSLAALLAGEEKTARKRGESSLLIMSGQKGRIASGKSIPYTDWFFTYSRNYGYYEKNTRFKNVNTGFVVEATAKKDAIGVIITPEVAYMADSAGRDSGTITYRALAATLDVKNGEPIVIGGDENDSDSTITRFLGGFEKTGEKGRFYMILTATIE